MPHQYHYTPTKQWSENSGKYQVLVRRWSIGTHMLLVEMENGGEKQFGKQCGSMSKIKHHWVALVAQRFSTTFSPGHDPGDPGSNPTSGSLHGACFSLCLCLCFSLSFCLS